ncbi:MAG TPA: 30S ribosomal protein S12 methylthiotransferase RimO, partial [Clostridiaceae bacterium]|nr:30S ribosomal protein S12 methylthiotransferase RimO [Clostridiaceae bacterium]HCL51498.1 30S ribosomal protein S12 methylthiotransferase RimO [Clostridiaceae bacterium]
LIKNSNKICHYFDIPLQHVSNEVLKRMRRRNTKEYTIELINKIRKEIPDAIIRTTFIVGFPGETDREFNELKEFVEDMKLDRVGVFAYSQEEGTEASLMEDQIEEKVKENRKEIIMKAMQKISAEKNNKLIGEVMDVIVDKKVHNGIYIGRTYGDAPDIDQNVTIKTNNHKINTGDIVKVKITKTFIYDLMGDVIYEYGQ